MQTHREHSSKAMVERLYGVLRRKLKARGLTYKKIANALNTTEVTVKRWFVDKRIPFNQLADMAELLGVTMTELMQEVEEPPLQLFNPEQGEALMNDLQLFVVTTCVFENWTLPEILARYHISEAECIACLLQLDKLRLIDLLPGNVIRLRVARGIATSSDDPLHQFVHGTLMREFFADPFINERDHTMVMHGMLTRHAIEQLHVYLLRLRQLFDQLHIESLNAPFEERHRTVICLGQREWWASHMAAHLIRRK